MALKDTKILRIFLKKYCDIFTMQDSMCVLVSSDRNVLLFFTMMPKNVSHSKKADKMDDVTIRRQRVGVETERKILGFEPSSSKKNFIVSKVPCFF